MRKAMGNKNREGFLLLKDPLNNVHAFKNRVCATNFDDLYMTLKWKYAQTRHLLGKCHQLCYIVFHFFPACS